MIKNHKIFEWFGAGCGMLGALLISLNNDISKYAFILYTLNNLAFISFSIITRHRGVLVMNLFFLATAIYALINWF